MDLEKTIQNLRKNEFEVSYFETAAEAAAWARCRRVLVTLGTAFVWRALERPGQKDNTIVARIERYLAAGVQMSEGPRSSQTMASSHFERFFGPGSKLLVPNENFAPIFFASFAASAASSSGRANRSA